MLLANLISKTALRLNPLVTGWDSAWRPTSLQFEDGFTLAGDPDSVRFAADGIEEAEAAAVAATLAAFDRTEFELPCPAGPIRCGKRTLVMGIINTTPDSFSDGGECLDSVQAIERGLELVAQGADILDVGGESTRPGADAVSADEERRRTEPVVAELVKRCGRPVSIDTSKASVAEAALGAGASIVNDVTALGDPDMAAVVAQAEAALVLMHIQGEPRTMQKNPEYANVLREIATHLRRAMAKAVAAGVGLDRVIVDPGIGFGKSFDHNLEIIKGLGKFQSLDRPILLGTSRKAFIGHILDKAPLDRETGTIATVVAGVMNGANIVRVHDVKRALEAVKITDAIKRGRVN